MSIALRVTDNVVELEYTVATGQAVSAGEAVVLASDTTVQDAGSASDLAVGVGKAAAAADAQATIYMFAGGGIIPVLVDTGGATRGKKAKIGSAGRFEDATTHDSDGTGNESTYGTFLQSKTAGQWVGLLLSGTGNRGV